MSYNSLDSIDETWTPEVTSEVEAAGLALIAVTECGNGERAIAELRAELTDETPDPEGPLTSAERAVIARAIQIIQERSEA